MYMRFVGLEMPKTIAQHAAEASIAQEVTLYVRDRFRVNPSRAIP